ncbi:MAG TPA: tetratricopeptide repeat protein [Chitinophagaceae bacterium]|nr:tetratricopeptide repeat protein [Chitinophagaceae bacterium]
MKNLLFLFFCLLCIHTAFPQSQAVDSLLQKLAVEKNEDKKVDLIVSLFLTGLDKDPYLTIQTGHAVLKQAQENNDLIKEASAYCILATGYRISGNPIRGLQLQQKALQLAEKANNFSILAMIKNQMGHTYRDRDEWENAFKMYSSAQDDAVRGKNEVIKIWPVMNLGVCYLNLNKLDSALRYLQRAYESSITINQWDVPYMLWNLGSVHSKMNNALLAVSYFKMSIQISEDAKRYRQLNFAYTGLAVHFQRMNQQDSCILYLKKALVSVQNTPFFFMSVTPAKMLADIYEQSNCDSTLKYAGIYKVANDSVFSNKINQEIQVMTFDEQLRQQELVTGKIKAEEQRQQNIQFALIALGIIVFIILFLLFSRSIVANQTLISFFGVLGLLIVFEFINLLIHPWLASFTHESPVLMLLVLVLIASLLIPLHHRLEKWIKEKMTEKNKTIRLAAAKKTIEKLEKKQESS